MFSRALSILVISVVCILSANAQDEKNIRVNGRFLVDSIKIGEAVPYSLSVYYPASSNLVFPDSTFSFAPFEFAKKKYFQTKTTNNISYDSVVYYLTTFEIDSIQSLKLPVYEINKKDCTAVFSQTDAVFLKQLVHQKLDSIEAPALPLKINTTYQNVKWLLDYPFLLALAGILILVLVVVWIVFGKRIKKYFKARNLSKNHEAFLNKFTSSVSQLNANFSTTKAEATMLLWKSYMEKLSGVPYTKYTSKEIIQQEKDKRLDTALKTVDRIIYGGSSPASESFEELRTFANAQFNTQLKDIHRG